MTLRSRWHVKITSLQNQRGKNRVHVFPTATIMHTFWVSIFFSVYICSTFWTGRWILPIFEGGNAIIPHCCQAKHQYLGCNLPPVGYKVWGAPSCCVRPYYRENTWTRPISEVKPGQAQLVLRWATTWEHWVLYAFLECGRVYPKFFQVKASRGHFYFTRLFKVTTSHFFWLRPIPNVAWTQNQKRLPPSKGV